MNPTQLPDGEKSGKRKAALLRNKKYRKRLIVGSAAALAVSAALVTAFFTRHRDIGDMSPPPRIDPGGLTEFTGLLGRPTTSRIFVPSWLDQSASMNDAYQRIVTALREAEFETFGVFSLKKLTGKEGFLVITAPERIGPEGKPTINRWELSRTLTNTSSLKEMFLKFFTTTKEGDFRVFVMGITPVIALVDSGHSQEWSVLKNAPLHGGEVAHLPPEIGTNRIGNARFHFYVYHFERGSSAVNPSPTAEQRFSIRDDAANAGLLLLFQQSNQR